MQDLRDLIRREEREITRLHSRVHETFNQKKREPEKWKHACKEFYSYVSAIDEYIDYAYREFKYTDAELLEFAISFLEVDPLFFRSGYVKAELLRKLKRSDLNAKQIERLNVVLVDAVDRRASREFKAYCRLAAIITNPKLTYIIKNAAEYGETSRKSRAKLMLNYIQQKNNQRDK